MSFDVAVHKFESGLSDLQAGPSLTLPSGPIIFKQQAQSGTSFQLVHRKCSDFFVLQRLLQWLCYLDNAFQIVSFAQL